LDADEREILADLIRSVRTLAGQMLRLHLQLGAVRTVLAQHGMARKRASEAAVAEMEAASSAEEVVNPEMPTVDEVFDDLLRRLGRAA
jgi:hypothetical protein